MQSYLSAALALWALCASFASGADAPASAKEVTLDMAGVARRFYVFAPSAPRSPLSVVLVFHGGGGNARQMERNSGFDELAEKQGFLAVYPEGIGNHWNDGRGVEFMQAQRENVDDVGFVRAIVERLSQDYQIDRGRIFATGISNGGFISHRLAAEASDLIAGIAPVVGGMAPLIGEKFSPKFPVSLLLIQGDSDRLVPLDGGFVQLGNAPRRGQVLATRETLGKYLKLNGNPGEPTIASVAAQPKDGTKVEMAKYKDGPSGAKTWFALVKGGGHSWPGRAQPARKGETSQPGDVFRATDTIWEFFKSCPSRTRS
ncbi:MAG TPA: PHB depolymerase family esterase [Pirellulales bacterium]|nr:PHB depolymerase family esterase [Pirellulales bacterium]